MTSEVLRIGGTCFDKLSMNGGLSSISFFCPFGLSVSKASDGEAHSISNSCQTLKGRPDSQ